ncbi:MAG: hypothetical protein D6722_27945, partial [Bacteroidetes bacterium]
MLAWLGLSLLWGLVGCDVFDKPETLPVYLDLREARIALDEDGTFTSRVGVRDFWIDHNGTQFGVYRIPSVVPLLPAEGGNRLTLSGGVFETGLSSLRARYPFWEPVTIEVEGEPLDTVPVSVTFSYYPDTVLAYPFAEDFENAAFGLTPTGSGFNRASLISTNQDAFQGFRSGRVEFTSDQYLFEVVGNEFIRLPQRGTNDIYFEITYKNNVAFTAGLYYISANGLERGEVPAGLFFNSGMVWNTVHI